MHSLLHSERVDLAVLLSDLVPNLIHTCRLQPCVGPSTEVFFYANFSGSLLHVADEVIKLRVLERVLLEVRLNSSGEHSSPELEKGLVQPTGTFSVRDAVENIVSHLGMRDVDADWMRSVLLVFTKAPEALVKENGPGRLVLLEAGRLIKADVADVVGEGLVQPQVVPPLHRDEVAEPHVRDLVQEHVQDGLPSRTGEAFVALHVLVSVYDAADVLHSTI